jgi:radical SAM protein with 4Fe4S-binding SPASM domain
MDAAMTTNGVLLTEKTLNAILQDLTWLRISLNAATPQTYSRIHATNPQDFNKVIKNLEKAVRIKKTKRYPCTIGAQFLLLKHNYTEAESLAKMLRKVGLDYLIIKPYSQHPLSKNRIAETLDYGEFLASEELLKKISTDSFKVIFRKNAMLKTSEAKPYRRCLGLPFWAHLTCEGDLYACSAFLGDKRFLYGNIYERPFDEIWKGTKRKAINAMMNCKWDVNRCRKACRMDEINKFLWGFKTPPPHINFI